MQGARAIGSALCVWALAAAGVIGQQPASLVVNGSFEDTPVTRTFTNVPAGSPVITGWVVTGEGIDLVAAAYWPASQGTKSIDLDGSRRSRLTPPYTHGGIAQTFATVPGARYLVTFDMAGNFVASPPVKPARVSAAAQSEDFTFDVRGKSQRNLGWVQKTWTFTAKEATTTLEFVSLTVSPRTGYGAAIDNVAVVEVGGREPLDVIESETEIQISLGAEVLFDTGQYTLRPVATEALQKLATVLRSYPGLPMLIEGHTDSVGRPEANQVLSENRATAVKEWLVANGDVTADRISIKGHGQTEPVASNNTEDGRQKNRRVEVRLPKTPARPTSGPSSGSAR